MNTKTLMVMSSLLLGFAGLIALFVPEELLKILSLSPADPLPVLIQLMGVLYLSFSLMNWTAKDNIIGGIYLRPISLANFAHFTMGALTLVKYQLSNFANGFLWGLMIVYFVFAIIFTWLVFVYGGLNNKSKT